MKKLFFSVFAALLFCCTAQAKVQLPKFFANDMVLQQNDNVTIWGTADPNSKLVITTTWSKAKTVIRVDVNGRWTAELSTPTAGGPYEITFNDGARHNTSLSTVFINFSI